MATNFDAMEWIQLNESRKGKPRDFNADYAEAVGTMEGLQSGMRPRDAVIQGMKSRETKLDPFYELKKSKYETDILATAKQMQGDLLSMQIKRKQMDDEAADDLASANLIRQFGGDTEKMLEGLNSTFWKSSRGIQNATQMRLQLSQLRAMDTASKAFSKLTPQQMAAVNQFEQGSEQWWNAIEKFSPKEATQPETVTLIETAKKYRAEGDTRSADMIEAILTERGRTKAGVTAEPRPYTVVKEDSEGNRTTIRMTESEYLSRPITDQSDVEMITEYSNLSSGADADNPIIGYFKTEKGKREARTSRMNEIKAELGKRGIDAETGQRTGQKKPNAAATREVIRITPDGRSAVFDSETRQFIRYAD